ncbi:MAG: hypothetical protein JKY41_01450 [Rhodobacteraceae bacterium]|nr:hypothetical protein [Paracoccaceae bacterium]
MLAINADPIYAGTYFPPNTFLSIRPQINDSLQADRVTLSADASELSGLIRDYIHGSAAAKDLSPEVVGGTGNVRSVSSGDAQVAADIDREADTITLQIKVKDGWHVNACEPLEDFSVPTDLTVGGVPIAAFGCPNSMLKSLALYEGELELLAAIPDTVPAVAV